MWLPRTPAKLLAHRRHRDDSDAGDLPQSLRGSQIRKGIVRVVLVAAVVVALITAVPGLGAVRTRLANGAADWLALAALLRLGSALSYVVAFRAVFAPRMSRRMSYRIAMSEIGLNALVPAGGVGGLAVGGWVLHRQGMPTERVTERSAEFFVFTSAFNVGAVAVLGWLGALGVVDMHAPAVFSLVPALGATGLIALAVAVAPRLAALQARQQRRTKRTIGWWTTELLVMVGTGARGAGRLFAEHNPRALLGGAGYLIFDIATLWAAVRAFHGDPGIAPLALAYLVGQLAGEIPVPGGIGVVDGGLIGAMVLYGVPAAVATAGALAYRAIALAVPTVFGGLAAIGLTHTIRGWSRGVAVPSLGDA
jgi:uncharacterized membrane protein YbhN (UPF0104 family)